MKNLKKIFIIIMVLFYIFLPKISYANEEDTIKEQQEEIGKKDKIIDKISQDPFNELRVDGIRFCGGDIKQYFENFMYRLILNNESHTFDETRSLNFYDFISRDEKIKTAKSILILLNLLDNTHLKSYFDNDDYLQYLQIWENEIIPKKNIAN